MIMRNAMIHIFYNATLPRIKEISDLKNPKLIFILSPA